MYRVAVITCSDKGHTGGREDASGRVAMDMAAQHGYTLAQYTVLPDDREMIGAELARLCDSGEADLILTTGGTGFSPRDVTPEATMDVVEKPCPGIPESMRAFSFTITKRAMFSRAAAGIRGKTLIVNLPGSPKAVRECLGHIIGDLGHGLDILTGHDGECAAPDTGNIPGR